MARTPASQVNGRSTLPAELSADVLTGVLYCDDNRTRLAQLPAESVDLIYLDPPFFSNRQYEVIWGDEAEVRSFEDRWEGGIEVYTGWMRERVEEMHRVLKSSGSLYLHCDWHASHYLRVMLDDIFGAKNFRNEIIWHYGLGAYAAQRRLPSKHDTILAYTKSQTYTFNKLRGDVSAAMLAKYCHEDADGKYMMSYGRKYYLKGGKPFDDVWDIPTIAPTAKERLGYPTQKPEALLERIVEFSSQKGDVVLDPFAGCGTTLVAAQRLQRRWIGIDISPTAIDLTKRRMQKVGALDVDTVGLPTTAAELRVIMPFEFQNWVIARFIGTHSTRKTGDMGIDGRSFFYHRPIQVKQSDRVGRNVVDNFETAVERDGKGKGYIVAFSFTRGAYEEAARAKSAKKVDIQLVTVSNLLKQVPDQISSSDHESLFPVDLPLPEARPPASRPSLDELLISARGGDIHEYPHTAPAA